MIKNITDKLLAPKQALNFYTTRRIYVINTLLIIMFFAMSIMAVLNLALFNNIPLASFDVIAALIPILTYLKLRKDERLEVAALIGASSIFVISIAFSLYNQNNNFGLIWSIFLPIFAMTMLGHQQGLKLTLLYLTIMIPASFLGVDSWQDGDWQIQSAIRYSIVLGTLTFIIYLYEKSIYRYHKSEIATQERLKTLSTSDFLTKLHNRRAMNEYLIQQVNAFDRYHEPFSIAIMDIDNFKQINDTFGHNQGDEVLKTIAQLLKNNLRKTEYVGRWGGEEFLIIFQRTNTFQAAQVCEKLRETISQVKLQEDKFVTASFGVAEMQIGMTPESVLSTADKVLYLAKKHGKNKVFSHEEHNFSSVLD